MKYLLVTLFLMIWVKAHPQLERDNMLHEAGVPEDFMLLFNEYVDLTGDSYHGATENDLAFIRDRQSEIIKLSRQKFPEKGGDYNAIILENIENSSIRDSAYVFYGKLKIPSQRMLDYARKKISDADWEGSLVSGHQSDFNLLFDSKNEKEIEFIKQIVARMDDVEKSRYRSVFQLLNRYEQGEMIPDSKIVIPKPKEKSNSNTPNTNQDREGLREDRRVEVSSKNPYFWISVFLMTLLLGAGYMVFRGRV